jgi:nitrate reductase delta subunit
MGEACEILAAFLEYPNDDWESRVAFARKVNCDPQSFIEGVQGLSLSELQELYTRTFDLNPACALEIGYHLFGENYKRGEFLANLRETETPFKLGQEKQLPDYLPVLLRLLTKLDDQELRDSLICECLIPALDKMLASLNDVENPYRNLLDAIRAALHLEVTARPTPEARLNMRASLPVIQPAEEATA